MVNVQPKTKLFMLKHVGWISVVFTGYMFGLTQVLGSESPPNRCGSSEMVYGYGLLGHHFKSVKVETSHDCYLRCEEDEKCKSLTYWQRTQQCHLNNETRRTKPGDFRKDTLVNYFEKPQIAEVIAAYKPVEVISKPVAQGKSCKQILDSGKSEGDGEYWIDPAGSGDSFKVYCDMTTDGGGWTLVKRLLLGTASSVSSFSSSHDYRAISNYTDNAVLVTAPALTDLRSVMGFDQFRFYCRKISPGRTFHVMTKNDSKGEKVVKYFTDSKTPAAACNSFTRLPDDNSVLSQKCRNWGYTITNKWGTTASTGDIRMYSRLVVWPFNKVVKLVASGDPWGHFCDETKGQRAAPTVGDEWKIFVR